MADDCTCGCCDTCQAADGDGQADHGADVLVSGVWLSPADAVRLQQRREGLRRRLWLSAKAKYMREQYRAAERGRR